MRVGERETSDRATRAGRTRGFDDALRGAWRSEARRRPPPRGEVPGGCELPAQVLGIRRTSADRAASLFLERREERSEPEREGAGPLTAQAASRPPARADSAPELRALVRTLPVAIEAARVRAGEPLSLSLGPALSVDLRRGAEGLEVVLRPDAALRRAAAAELPALVAALRERGFSVARAEVRAQPNGNPAARRPAR